MAASKQQQQRYSGTGAISRLISSLSGFLGAVAVVLKAVTSSSRRRGGVIENHHSFCLTKKNDGRLYSERSSRSMYVAGDIFNSTHEILLLCVFFYALMIYTLCQIQPSFLLCRLPSKLASWTLQSIGFLF